jgi:hypothetical protein
MRDILAIIIALFVFSCTDLKTQINPIDNSLVQENSDGQSILPEIIEAIPEPLLAMPQEFVFFPHGGSNSKRKFHCGGDAPTCSGSCPSDFDCGVSNNICTCLPKPLTCSQSAEPTCGGTCPENQVCAASQSGCSCFQPGWTPPVTLDSQNASSAAPLVVDQNGNVVSAWLENYDLVGDDPQAIYFSSSLDQWAAPASIILAGAGLTAPQLIVDNLGTTTLVWLEYFSENSNSATLFATRSTNGGPWTTPVPLNSLPDNIPTNAGPVSMVVDHLGNVVIIWLEQDLDTSTYAIQAARFSPDINTPPTLYDFIDGAAPNANNNIMPKIVVDQSGYVTAIWQEQTILGFSIQASRLDPTGLTWSTPTDLNGPSLNANPGIPLAMVVDNSDIVTAIWQEQSGTSFAVQAARFVPETGDVGGSWITYTTLSTALSNANSSLVPEIIVDSLGSVTVVAVDANFSVWPASFLANGSAWTSPATPLNNGAAFSLTPLTMVADFDGLVTVLWLNNDSGLFVQASRGSSSTWNAAQNLNSGNADASTALLAVVDSLGNITASWMEGSYMEAARFLHGGSSWGEAIKLDNGNLYNLIAPKMVIGPSGAVTVAWQEGPTLGAYAIQAAHFIPEQASWTTATLDNGSQTPNAFSSSMTQQINMVVDPFDNVTVTWLESLASTIAVQAARYLATPLF